MEAVQNKILILKEDYLLLSACVKHTKKVAEREPHHSRALSEEMKRAVLVERDEFPADVIRLNSAVTIKNMGNGNEISLRIVLPEFADIKQKNISVLAPMGTALIGFKKGDCVTWQMPSGIKKLLILEVTAEQTS